MYVTTSLDTYFSRISTAQLPSAGVRTKLMIIEYKGQLGRRLYEHVSTVRDGTVILIVVT